MPSAPNRPCTHPGCRRAQPCPDHRRDYDKSRSNASARGYDWDWRRKRDWFIAQVQCTVCGQNHTLCAECLKAGRYVPAYAVDHIVPHRGDRALFEDHYNLQSLCARHHAEKSGREVFHRS